MVSKAPLGDIINNAEATGRVAKRGIELAAFDIHYKPRTAIKSQALADFVADWTEAMEDTPLPESEYWIMHFDGSKMLGGWRCLEVSQRRSNLLRPTDTLQRHKQRGRI